MAQKEDEHRVIGGTAIEKKKKKKKSKTTEENGAIKMKGNRNENINEDGAQRGPEEGGRDTGEQEITQKKKKKKSKTTEENGAIKMKGNRNENRNEDVEQRGPEEGGRDTGEQEITQKKKKKKKGNQEYGHSPDTEEGGQEMRKKVVKTTGTEPVEDRDEEENPKLKKKKKKHKSEESEEIQQHPVKAVKQKQAGAEKRKKKRKHKEMEQQEEGGGVEVEEEKGVCAKKKKRVNDGRGRQEEDGGVIEPEGSKEKQLKKRKKRLVEQEDGTEEGKKKQKGLPSETVSQQQEMPNKQIDKKKKMKKYLCSEETKGVEKEEMGTVTKKKGKRKAKLDAIQEGDDVEREDGDGGSLKKKQKKKKVMEEVKLLTAMEKNNKGVKVKIKIEDEYSGNKPEFEIVSVKPGNTDEVNIDKERRQALQEEIDRESCPPPHDPVTGASFGQWGTATFGNVDRQNKFLRLMGGFKKSGQSMVPEGRVKAERPNMALNQADQDQLTRGLQGEFDRAQNRRLHPQQKGVGLGFQSAPSKFRIDREASKSIKFED